MLPSELDPVTAAIPLAVLDLHRRCNDGSADRWAFFSDHRRRVTNLALKAGGDTLAVLGAGNCNDLHLGALFGQYREVHLVDLDRRALQRAVAGRSPSSASRVVLHTPVDLSGSLDRLACFRDRRPTDDDLARMPSEILDRVLRAVPERFDTVVSSCLLSQLLHGCAVALGADHPDVPVLSCVIALAHVRCMASLVKPGGTGVLVTDMASSDRNFLRELEPSGNLRALARRLELAHRSASGTGPAFLERVLADDAVITPLLAGSPSPLEPWLWRFGNTLSYLVHGFVFQRRAEA